MTREQASEYALRWAEAWNRRDLDEVLVHFADDIVFTSPKALQTVGVPSVRGKAALRSYWEQGLRRIGSIHFEVIRVLWDAATRELAIVYDRTADGDQIRVAEVLRFGADDRVAEAEVWHGIVPRG